MSMSHFYLTSVTVCFIWITLCASLELGCCYSNLIENSAEQRTEERWTALLLLPHQKQPPMEKLLHSRWIRCPLHGRMGWKQACDSGLVWPKYFYLRISSLKLSEPSEKCLTSHFCFLCFWITTHESALHSALVSQFHMLAKVAFFLFVCYWLCTRKSSSHTASGQSEPRICPHSLRPDRISLAKFLRRPWSQGSRKTKTK